MGPSRPQLRGLVNTIRGGNATARALAIADSSAVVRSLFLASAIRIGLVDLLCESRTFAEIAASTGCTRAERLQAWLDVGLELGEITVHGDRYRLKGRRARAIASPDAVLHAHYRSILDYQAGPYADLEDLLRSDPGDGRGDVDQFADEIAQVSMAAAPFVASYLTGVIGNLRPARVLDVGCGTGIYSRIAASLDPQIRVEGVDLAADVIAAAGAEARSAGLDDRIEFHVGDIRQWTPGSRGAYDLVMLLNSIYYIPRQQRVVLYRQLSGLLRPHGQLVVSSMTAPGSPAAAHLHFMLACQAGAAALPRPGELQKDLSEAGFEVNEIQVLVPTEPFVAITSTLR